MDVWTLLAAVDSLRADIDTILEARVPESEAPSVESAEDTVLAALFATSPSRECQEAYGSSRGRGASMEEGAPRDGGC